MSYILDALADSEQARQQMAAVPKYSLLPVVGEEQPHQRRWPYVLAAALLVNVAVLQVWLRPALSGGTASNKLSTVREAAQLPAAEAQQPASAAQLPAAATQLPASAAQQPAAVAQQAASAAQLPAAATQLPASAAQLPAAATQLLAVSAQPPAATAQPFIGQAVRSDKPAADVAAVPVPEAKAPQSQPERVGNGRVARAAVPAEVLSSTASANAAHDSVPIRIPKLAPPKVVLAKRSGEAAIAARANPTLTSPAPPSAAGANPATVSPAPSAVAKANPSPPPPAPSPAAVAIASPPSSSLSPPAPSPAAAGATAELPPVLQQELPALLVAGFIRDENSSSLVIVNDRLVREGDEVAPGVKLEKIVNDSLIFSYKGYRFKR